VTAHLKPQLGKPIPPDALTKIARLFAARHLEQEWSCHVWLRQLPLRDVMFVDVAVLLHDGKQLLRRTMVIKDRDGRWYVHPVPDVSPLLSSGLYDETPSVDLLSDASIER
jgi:hypothetical protein